MTGQTALTSTRSDSAATSSTDVVQLLESLAVQGAMPDSTPCRALSLAAARQVAAKLGLPERQVEIEALRLEIIPERYIRNFRAFSYADQIRLLQCRAVMVGLGGLGGHVLEMLARLGFGRIRAADHDVFAESNLNRQLLCREETLGRPKAVAAKERVREINPSVEFEASQSFLDGESLAGFFQGADLVLDCLGGLASRLVLHEAAARAGLPMITAGVAGWTGFAATTLPGDPGPAQYLCPPVALEGQAAPCAEDVLGCLSPTIAVAAGLLCSEACRVALGQTPRLRAPDGRMLFFDLSDMSFETLSFGC